MNYGVWIVGLYSIFNVLLGDMNIAKSAETYEMSEYNRMADTIIALVSTNIRPDAWDETDVLKLSTSLRDDNPCKYYLTVSASIVYGKKTRLFLLAPLGACGIRFYYSVSLDLYGDMIYIIFWNNHDIRGTHMDVVATHMTSEGVRRVKENRESLADWLNTQAAQGVPIERISCSDKGRIHAWKNY